MTINKNFMDKATATGLANLLDQYSDRFRVMDGVRRKRAADGTLTSCAVLKHWNFPDPVKAAFDAAIADTGLPGEYNEAWFVRLEKSEQIGEHAGVPHNPMQCVAIALKDKQQITVDGQTRSLSAGTLVSWPLDVPYAIPKAGKRNYFLCFLVTRTAARLAKTGL